MPDSDHEQSCAFLIYDTVRLIRRRFDAAISDLGLTEAKWRILATLKRWPGMSQSAIADRLDIEKAPAGLALDWLEGKGWVRREPDQADRRARRVWLQDDAAPTLERMLERFRGVEANYLRGFDTEEIEGICSSLRVIRRELRTVAPEPEAPLPAAGDGQPDSFSSLMFDCARLLTKRFDTRLAELGFTRNQWLVLNTVTRNEGLRQTQIAEITQMAVAPLGKIVDALERDKWLERKPDPRDRRANRLHTSARARHLINGMRQRFETLHARLVNPLGADRRRQLIDSLGWIRQRLLEEPLAGADLRRIGET